MIVIYLLIPLSILMALIFLGGFIWAVRSGQWEDTSTPSMRLLNEDPSERAANKTTNASVQVGTPRRGVRGAVSAKPVPLRTPRRGVPASAFCPPEQSPIHTPGEAVPAGKIK